MVGLKNQKTGPLIEMNQLCKWNKKKIQNDAYQMLAKQWVVIFWESEYKAIIIFSLYLLVFYIL